MEEQLALTHEEQLALMHGGAALRDGAAAQGASERGDISKILIGRAEDQNHQPVLAACSIGGIIINKCH